MLSWHVALLERHKGVIAGESVAAKGFEVFNPQIKTVQKWSRGRTQTRIRQYIPGYLFVRFDVNVPGWEILNRLPGSGVRSLMYAASEVPARVRDEALIPLMRLCGADGYIQEQEADQLLYKVGMMVKVIEGPFAGWRGPITWTKNDRLKVLLHLFGRPNEIAGDIGMFELVR